MSYLKYTYVYTSNNSIPVLLERENEDLRLSNLPKVS